MSNQVTLITLATPDPAEQETMAYYAKASFELAQEYGVEVLVRSGVSEHLHGNRPTAIVGIAAFPDAETIKALFNSKAYQALIPHREKALKAVNLYISQPIKLPPIQVEENKAYLVTMAVPANKESLMQYQQGAGSIAGKYGAQPVANIPLAETFLGDSPAAFLSIAAFPDAEAIKGFFADDAYQPLIPLRDEALNKLNLYVIG